MRGGIYRRVSNIHIGREDINCDIIVLGDGRYEEAILMPHDALALAVDLVGCLYDIATEELRWTQKEIESLEKTADEEKKKKIAEELEKKARELEAFKEDLSSVMHKLANHEVKETAKLITGRLPEVEG